MEKINVEAILGKHKVEIGIFDDGKLKAAIKEIVEAVIDKCAENADVDYDYIQPCSCMPDKQSILNIKKEINYE